MKSELVRATNHLNIGKGRCNGWIEQPEEIKSGIYCWTNKVNGKRYIGQSFQLQTRKRVFINFSRYDYSGVKINNARQKYNSSHQWSYKIIEFCDPDNLDEREIEYIAKFDTITNGYNMSEGGDGARMRGESNPRWGVPLSDEAKEKISEANSIPVRQYDLNGNFIREWKSAREAGKQLHLQYSNINSCCHNKAKKCGGYLWSYATVLEVEPYQTNGEKPIYQIDINSGEIIASYNTLKEAAEKYNIDISCISATCRGRHNFYKGYIWVFQSKYSEEDIRQRLIKIDQSINHIISDETRAKMSERNKGHNNPNYGKRHSAEVKARISQANKGRKFHAIWNNKPVNQYTPEGDFVRRWNSATEAEVALNGKKVGFISKVLRNTKRTAYGYKWEYADK